VELLSAGAMTEESAMLTSSSFAVRSKVSFWDFWPLLLPLLLFLLPPLLWLLPLFWPLLLLPLFLLLSLLLLSLLVWLLPLLWPLPLFLSLPLLLPSPLFLPLLPLLDLAGLALDSVGRLAGLVRMTLMGLARKGLALMRLWRTGLLRLGLSRA